MKKYFIATLFILLAGVSLNTCSAKTTSKAPKPGITASKKVAAPAKVVWTAAALKKLRRVPRFARAVMKAKINAYAIKHNIKVITAEIYDSIHV